MIIRVFTLIVILANAAFMSGCKIANRSCQGVSANTHIAYNADYEAMVIELGQGARMLVDRRRPTPDYISITFPKPGDENLETFWLFSKEIEGWAVSVNSPVYGNDRIRNRYQSVSDYHAETERARTLEMVDVDNDGLWDVYKAEGKSENIQD